MTHPTFPVRPASPETTTASRPGTVTAASFLLALAAVTAVSSATMAILMLDQIGPKVTALDNQCALTDPANDGWTPSGGAFWTTSMVLWVVSNLLIAVTMIPLVMLNLRGRNGARITTFVLAALFPLYGTCCGIGNLSYIGTAGSSSPHPCSDDILSQLRELYPTWYKSLAVGLAGVQSIIYPLVIVLLALPTSREFFHRWSRLPEW